MGDLTPTSSASSNHKDLKVLVADKLSPQGLSILQSVFTVDIQTGLNEQQLCDLIPSYSALLVRSETTVTAKVLECAKKLQVIGRAGVGVDNIDVDSATKKGIIVLNSPTGNIAAAAEHTIALMMALARNVPRASSLMKEGKWERSSLVGVEVKGKVLGIIGLGKVGLHVARCANGLGMKVVATDPYASAAIAAQNNVTLISLPDVLKSCDFLTIHTPLISSTKGMISASEIATMKPNSHIINVARGGLIDETALLAALESKHIRGAAIDVFPQEPPAPDSPSTKLIAHPMCISTPHLGASTSEAQIQVAVDVCEQVLSVLQGLLPRSAVNAPLVISQTEFARLQPYVLLVEKMGELYTQHFKQTPKTFSITYAGDIAAINSQPLYAALVKGLTKSISSSTNVNIVNATLVAQDRGIVINESHIRQNSVTTYSSLVTLQSYNNVTKQEQIISGFCLETQPVIVRLGQFSTQFRPQGNLLICHNFDQPGMIGSVGEILGRKGVNIHSMSVAPLSAGEGSRSEKGEALMILGLDKAVDRETLDEISHHRGILETDIVSL